MYQLLKKFKIVFWFFSLGALVILSMPYSATTINAAEHDNVGSVMIPSESEYQFNVNGTTSLTAAEFNKKVKSNVPFLLYLGKEECVWCRIFSPVIKQYEDRTKLQPAIYYLDLHQLELHQDNTDVQTAVSHLKNLTIVATPTIAAVHGQNVIAGFAGAKHTVDELIKVASTVYDYDN